VKEIINLSEGHILAIVPDDDYSKAIGKNGVNVDLASRLTGVEIEIKKVSEYEKELAEKDLAEKKIEDVKGINKDLKKLLIEKGYNNCLAVIKAPPDELKVLLDLDDDQVAKLLKAVKPQEEKSAEGTEDAPEKST
jgi:N utilization substance protein A